MTNESETGSRRIFVPAILPWLLGAGMFALYVLTLYHTPSSQSMVRLAVVSGWDWRPQLFAPLSYFATYPISWLPAEFQLPALNLFAAACAALTLVLLARSVALLPHDRTNEQRLRETNEFSMLSIPTAGLASLFAVLICGLQITFWERSVQFVDVSMFDNGEMINLLLFAYVIRCLLEFRIHEHQRWMSRAALAYGLAMANNWSMICFLPLFLAALIWIKGFDFFDWRFVLRMFLWGLLGLSVMLILPLCIQFRHLGGFGFWQSLHYFLATEKGAIVMVASLRRWFPVLAVTSVMPVLLIGIRWATSFGDNSPLGVLLASLTMTLAHGFFLVCCLWMALDPTFGPRQVLGGVPGLPLFYLGALSIGYFVGYFLLVFGKRPVKQRQRTPALVHWLNCAVIAVVLLLMTGVSGLLAVNNSVRIANGRKNAAAANDYFTRIAKALPPQKAVVLSDDAGMLFHLQAAEIARKSPRNDVLIDTSSLSQSWVYVDAQDRLHPQDRIAAAFADRKPLTPPQVDCIHLIESLSTQHGIYYLHPSYGYYFERFYAEPHGLVYQLKTYPTNSWAPPPLEPSVYSENVAFWKDATNEMPALIQAINKQPAPSTNSWQRFERGALFAPEVDRDTLELAQIYSRALDTWGVHIQRAAPRGDLDKLGESQLCFDLAKQLNAFNGPAAVNLEFNRHLRSSALSVTNAPISEDKLPGSFRNWYDEITSGGPFDEPHYCAAFGLQLRNGNNFRQAIIEFQRLETLMPDSLAAPTLLAQTYAIIPSADDALAYSFPSSAAACFDAAAAADRALKLAPADTNALYLKSLCALRLGTYLQSESNDLERPYPTATNAYTAGLDAANRLIRSAGELPAAIYLKANALMQLRRFDEAIPLWSDLILIQTNTPSLYFNRAIANFQGAHFDAAKRDYEFLLTGDPHLYPAYYGLAEIAYGNKHYADAITNYELYLSNAPASWRQSTEYQDVEKRVKELKNAAP